MNFKWNGDYLDEGDFRLFIDGKPSSLVAFQIEEGKFELEEGMLESGPELPEDWADVHSILIAESEKLVADTYRDKPVSEAEASSEEAISPSPYMSELDESAEQDDSHTASEGDEEDPWLPSASHRDKRAAAREAKIARRKQREELGEVIPLRKKIISGSIAASFIIMVATGGGLWFAMNQPQPAVASLAYPPAIVGYSVLPEDVEANVETVSTLIDDANDLLKESKNKVARGGGALRTELRDTAKECRANVLDVRFPSEDEVERCIEVLREGIEALQESHDKWLEDEEKRQEERRQQNNNNDNNGGNNNPPPSNNNNNPPPSNNNNNPPPTQPPPTNNPPPTQQPGGSFTISCTTDHTLTVSATGGVNVSGRSGPSVTLSGGPGATYSGTYNGVVSMTATGICSIS